MSVYRKKIFPVRLPSSFHGQIQHKNLREQYKDRVQSTNPKIVNWQIKRKNTDILNEKRQFLAHTGKISNDTPFWFQTTSDFYRRHQAHKLRTKQPVQQAKKIDVFNRKRFSLNDWRSNTQPLDEKLVSKRSYLMQKNTAWNVTGKIGEPSEPRSSSINFFSNKSEVAAKVGSVQMRDFSIRKPQMKVGKSQFIDTYSPF